MLCRIGFILAIFASHLFAKEPYVILSIDGGGIRGVIPARILSHFEEEYGVSISELVDCFAGSSTGGMITLGLTLPNPINPHKARYSAKWIEGIYATKGDLIFQNSWWHWFCALGGMIGPEYESDAFGKLLQEIVGQTKLDQLIKDVLITSFDVTTHQPFLFEHFNSYTLHDAPLIDIALSTTAAPTYFPSHLLNEHNLVDGGILANCPAGWAYLELLNKEVLNSKDVYIFSLGSGELIETADMDTHPNLITSVKEVINSLFDATEDGMEELLNLAMKNNKIHFIRWQPILATVDQSKLDNISKENIASLQDLASAYFQTHFLEPQFDPFRKIFSIRAQESKGVLESH